MSTNAPTPDDLALMQEIRGEAAVLRAVGLPRGALARADNVLPLDRSARLIELCVQRSGRPDLALLIGQRIEPTLSLTLCTLVVAVSVAVPLGEGAARDGSIVITVRDVTARKELEVARDVRARDALRASTSGGKRNQSAVMPSSLTMDRSATT